MDQYLDAWFLMAYDYAGSWDDTTGHAANVYPDHDNPLATKYNTDQAVTDYIAGGISSDKIVLGIPLYGRSFTGSNGNFGEAYNGVGKGLFEEGVWPYDILPLNAQEEHINTELIAAWTYDPVTQELVSYDNLDTAKLKAQYIKDKHLRGAMWWEAASDKTGDESLVRNIQKDLGDLDQSENMLDYPNSIYGNIRNRMR